MLKIKTVVCLLLVAVGIGCQSKPDVEAIEAHINGYWEIEKAQLPDGTEKDYTVNATLDYFELKEDKSGVRYKVVPQFNGEYLTNEVPEDFRLIEDKGAVWLEYKTEFSTWKEEVLRVSEEQLIMENENKIKYYYKRANPIQIKA